MRAVDGTREGVFTALMAPAGPRATHLPNPGQRVWLCAVPPIAWQAVKYAEGVGGGSAAGVQSVGGVGEVGAFLAATQETFWPVTPTESRRRPG